MSYRLYNICIAYFKSNRLTLDENSHWEKVKSNCTSPYKCSFCGDNCLRDKQVIFQLGSNDLLKREVPQYPYQRRKNTINVKWGKALNIMMQKMRFSAVYEVILMDIPEFPFLDMTTGERYISIKSRLDQKFTDRAILVRSVDQVIGPVITGLN